MRESCPEEFISRLLQDPGGKLLATAAAAAAINAIASNNAGFKAFYTALNEKIIEEILKYQPKVRKNATCC